MAKKLLLLALFAALIVSFFAFDLNQYFTLTGAEILGR